MHKRRKSISKKWNALVSKRPAESKAEAAEHDPRLQKPKSTSQLHLPPPAMLFEVRAEQSSSGLRLAASPADRRKKRGKSSNKVRRSPMMARKKASAMGLAAVERKRSKSADRGPKSLEELRAGMLLVQQNLFEELQLLVTLLEAVPVRIVSAMLIRMEGNVAGVAHFLVDRGWGRGGRGLKLLEEFRFTNKQDSHFTTRYFHGLYCEKWVEKLRRSQPCSYLTYYRRDATEQDILTALMEQMTEASLAEPGAAPAPPPAFDEVVYILHDKDASGQLGFVQISGPSTAEHKNVLDLLELRYPIQKHSADDLVPSVLPGLSHWEEKMGRQATAALSTSQP
jgi:hypothetical protein